MPPTYEVTLTLTLEHEAASILRDRFGALVVQVGLHYDKHYAAGCPSKPDLPFETVAFVTWNHEANGPKAAPPYTRTSMKLKEE